MGPRLEAGFDLGTRACHKPQTACNPGRTFRYYVTRVLCVDISAGAYHSRASSKECFTPPKAWLSCPDQPKKSRARRRGPGQDPRYSLRRARHQNLVHLLGGQNLIATGDGGNLAGKTLKRGLIKLTLGIALLALIVAAMQVAHDLGDGDQITGVDLLLVFLGAARPHRALDLGLALERGHRLRDHVGAGQAAHSDFGG